LSEKDTAMIYFEDLLKTADFGQSVSAIAKDFREKYEFPGVRQLGIVVSNVETAAAELEDKGICLFFIASDTLDSWNERGKNKTFSGKVGLACHKGYEIELLEPGVGSNFYKSCVDKKGRMVLQHLGFSVKDVDSFKRKLEELGNKTWVRGRIKSLGLVTEFAYMDTVKQAGIIMELIDMRYFGISLKPHAGFYHNFGRLEKLIGKRSLSF